MQADIRRENRVDAEDARKGPGVRVRGAGDASINGWYSLRENDFKLTCQITEECESCGGYGSVIADCWFRTQMNNCKGREGMTEEQKANLPFGCPKELRCDECTCKACRGEGQSHSSQKDRTRWLRYTQGRPWYEKDDGCYLYWHDGYPRRSYKAWWCVSAQNRRLYFVKSEAALPPANGWATCLGKDPAPQMRVVS